MDNVYDFGLRLKEQREKVNVTQKQIADKLKISVSTIKKYESNTLLSPVDKLEKMAIVYKTSLDYIRNIDKREFIYIDDFTPEQQKLVRGLIDKLRTELTLFLLLD